MRALSHDHPVRRMLAVPGFRRLLSIRLVGQAGDGLFQGALFGATFFNPEKSTSAGQAAAAFAVLLLPYSFVGPFAGLLLDRWSRQRVLVVTNAVRAALLLVLALSLASTGPTSGTTLGLALALVSANRFVLSGLSASLPHVVEESHLVTGNAFTTTLGTVAAAAGGVSSVGLRALWGSGDAQLARVAVTGALAYATAGLLATRIGRGLLGPDATGAMAPLARRTRELATGLVAGARHLAAHPVAARSLMVMGAHRFFSGLLFVCTLLLYTPRGYLHDGFAGLGLALGLAVAGGLLAALVTPAATRRLGPHTWIVAALVGCATVTGAVLPWWRQPAVLAGGFGIGLCAQSAKICVDTLVQQHVDDDFRGRVFALYDALFNVTFVGAAVLAASFVPDDGRSTPTLLVVTAGYLATAVAYRLGTGVTGASARSPASAGAAAAAAATD